MGMNFLIPVLAAVLGIVVIIFLVMMFGSRKGGGGAKRSKGREGIIKSATKRLEQNPRDPHALSDLGEDRKSVV